MSLDLQAQTCPLAQINPFDPALLQNPYPYFARLRDEAPVYRHPARKASQLRRFQVVRPGLPVAR